QSGNNVNSAFACFRTIGYIFSVWRPIRLPVIAWCCGELDRIASAYFLYPDIELSAAIGSVGYKTPVRRPRRLKLETFVEGKTCERALHRYRYFRAFVKEAGTD